MTASHPAWQSSGFALVRIFLLSRIEEGNAERAYRLAVELAHYARAVDSRSGNWSK